MPVAQRVMKQQEEGRNSQIVQPRPQKFVHHLGEQRVEGQREQVSLEKLNSIGSVGAFKRGSSLAQPNQP